jgi:hypothetical protein
VIADQRRVLKLSDGARNVEENPNDAEIRRIRGPAGSGKTMGLAARAARSASEGRSVRFEKQLVGVICRTFYADASLLVEQNGS